MDLKKFHWILILLLIVFISIFIGRKSIYEGAEGDTSTTTGNTTTTSGNTTTTTSSISVQPGTESVPNVQGANAELQQAQTDRDLKWAEYTTYSQTNENLKNNLSDKRLYLASQAKSITDADNTITGIQDETTKALIKPEWPKDNSGIDTKQLKFYYPLKEDLVNYAIGVQDIAPYNDASIKDGSIALNERAVQSIILPPITPTAKFAIACWVNTNSGNKWARIFDLGNGAGNNLVAYIGNNGNIGFGTAGLLGDIQPIANQGWKHIAWIFDVDTSGKRQGLIYINGKLEKQFDGSSSPVNVEFKSNFIGQSNWINDPFLAGNISEFRIYNRALTLDEVTKLSQYNKPTTTAPSYQPIDSNVLSNEVGLAKNSLICQLLLEKDVTNTAPNTQIQVQNVGNVAFGKYYNRPCALFNNNMNNFLTFPFSNIPKFSFCYWMYVPVSDNTEYTLISYTNSRWLPSIQADIMLGNNIKMVFALPKHWNDYYHKDLDYRDRWTHVTYTIDQNNFTAQLFVNGKPVANVKGTGPLGYTPDRFIIGRSGDHGRAFRGGISDFRIYDKVLKPEDISKIYTEGGGDNGSKYMGVITKSAIKCSKKDRFCISNETDTNGIQNYYCYGSTHGCLWHTNDCDSDEKCKQKYVNSDGSYKTDKRYTDTPNNITTTCSVINNLYPDPSATAWPKQACSISQNPLNTDPTLSVYYRFNEGDLKGTDLYNYANVPISTDATIMNGAGISSSDKKVGSGSLFLNAKKSQYVKISNLITGSNGLTFSFWFKSNGSGSYSRVFDFGNGNGGDNILFTPNYNGSGKPGLHAYRSGKIKHLDISNPNINTNNNQWYHYAWTMNNNSENSEYKVYQNGAEIATFYGYYPNSMSRNNLYIGRSNWKENPYFNGFIDEFRMYNRVLTPNEITTLYNYTG